MAWPRRPGPRCPPGWPSPPMSAARSKARAREALLGPPRIHVFPRLCTRCGEPMRIIAFVTDVGSTQHLLGYLGESTQALRIAPAARSPPGWEEDFDPREGDTVARRASLAAFDQRVSLMGERQETFPLPLFLPVHPSRGVRFCSLREVLLSWSTGCEGVKSASSRI